MPEAAWGRLCTRTVAKINCVIMQGVLGALASTALWAMYGALLGSLSTAAKWASTGRLELHAGFHMHNSLSFCRVHVLVSKLLGEGPPTSLP